MVQEVSPPASDPPTPTDLTYATQRKRHFEINSILHAVVIILVLISATWLRVRNQLDTATISTVYGAIIGYATGLTVQGGRSAGRARGL